jgi:2-keto-4-pentenoate hydratase/2-oxohepta-3-ene-1,7-dioic acid hydratase in catechol pathway
MKLVTIDAVPGGVPGALLRSGEVLHLGKAASPNSVEAWLPNSVQGLLEAGDEGLAIVRRMVARADAAGAEELQRLRATGALLPAGTRLLAPLPRPALVLAAGLAYRSHLAEMADTAAPPHPTAFTKSPHSITGPEAAVPAPRNASQCIDYEGELAVVFGRECFCVSPAEAMQYVAGYMAANDISARDWVKEVWAAQDPWKARLTWEVNLMGKQFPAFTPLGPVLLTADEVPDVKALSLTTRLNGKVMQQAPVSDLIFDLPDTIAYFSRWYRFQPGDVLLTGTPAGVGVGHKPPVFMHPGDVVEVEIDGIGCLRNTIVEAA